MNFRSCSWKLNSILGRTVHKVGPGVRHLRYANGQTDRLTDRQTSMLITILRTSNGGEVRSSWTLWIAVSSRLKVMKILLTKFLTADWLSTFVSFLYLIVHFVFTILAQIARRHWALAEWRHRKSTWYDMIWTSYLDRSVESSSRFGE